MPKPAANSPASAVGEWPYRQNTTKPAAVTARDAATSVRVH
jgi:hypothetical protein